MIKILKNLKLKEWLLVLISIVFILVQIRLDLLLPDYMSNITTLVQTEGSEMKDILSAGGMMLICTLGSVALSIIVGFYSSRIAASLSRRVRGRLFDKVQSFSMEEMNRFSTSSLITRSTNDITQVQTIVAMGLQVMIKAPLLSFFAIRKMLDKSWQWSLVTAGAILFLIIVIVVIVTVAMPRFKLIQTLTDNLNMVTRENLTGIRVVRAYNAEEYQGRRFKKASKELRDNYLFATRVMSIMQPSMTFIMSGISLGIYWMGAHLIENAVLADKLPLFSNMVVFSSYAVQTVIAFIMMSMIFIMMPRASVSANRINEVLDTKPTIRFGDKTEKDTNHSGEIEFRNVSFKYPDAEEYILKDISLKIQKGQTVAFIGSTGSGKSTLINLVPRFYDVSEGEVLINGLDVQEYSEEALYQKIGYVPQKAVIFSGTVGSNVDFGENKSGKLDQEGIKRAIRIAQGQEFVEKMPDQYESAISQGGTNISGGQKQRLAIARAVAREPEIYIFDDSFSALDYKTDQQLRQVLSEEAAGATSLIVAQRIGTIKNADQIVVLDEGKIVGIGTHQELLKTCTVYQEIAESQLSKEELANG